MMRRSKNRHERSVVAGRRGGVTKVLGLMMVFVACAPGCSRLRTSDPAEYLKWLNDPANGLTQSRSIGGLRITVSYLPSDYRAYQELRSGGGHGEYGRLALQSDSTVALRLSVTIDSAQTEGATVDAETIARAGAALNDEIREQLELRCGGRAYRPVLTAPDTDGGMSAAMSVMVVFADDRERTALGRSAPFDIVLDDRLFNTGISHFLVSREAIDTRVRIEL